MKRKLLVFVILILTASFLFAENDTKIVELERRIAVLEEFILPLIESADSAEVNSMSVPLIVETDVIDIDLLELAYHESNAANDYANDYSDWISMSFKFTNNTDKDLKAMKGAVVFEDLFGEEWMRIGLTVNDPIPSKETFLWEGLIDYNMFNDQHQKLRSSKVGDVVVSYDLSQILYSDGERVSFK